ncbi:GyrI-like domain-containing protein [Jiulongibacter sediminis]|uniref:AraC effector-binding domain-containing protein n=1 Tax=Jiulongibacter sediminis TaxID=1605367 RepID=A0A0P7C1D4_9BACT|nr:GyrI-like domain-containing protein [Jiulongibacter sediminis]KPM47792.1 hypothetical protein AFM12_11050 [Jiulongibacter sediminis]TBX23976.1 hypothetical protein TK44_11055 [Jiulongibacter sediminis]
MQNPRIENISPKKLVGMMMPMSFQNHNPGPLWSKFMPLRNTIQHRIDHRFVSLQRSPEGLLMSEYTPSTIFEKWALVEVSAFENIPEGMKSFELTEGYYAVFRHVGNTPQGFMKSIGYILNEWLPSSGFHLDNRPHFEVLDEKYDRLNPASEEDIWIPIKK